jgi:hypothetical protein
MLLQDSVRPYYVNDIKYDEFYTLKNVLNEDVIQGVNVDKFIPDFPVNTPIKFDRDKMIKAIEYGMLIRILYSGDQDKWKGGRERIIAPLVMGINKNTGNLLIRAFHMDGYSIKERKNTKKVWRLFKASNIKSMTFIGDFFRLPPKGYKMNDRVMTETTIARADFNKIRKNQYKLIQADKIQKAEEQEITGKSNALATAIDVKNTDTILNMKNMWENTLLDKKQAKSLKITFLKSVFGNEYIAVAGALGTPGRTVKLFEDKKLLGSYKTIFSSFASELTYKKNIKGQVEFQLYNFISKK